MLKDNIKYLRESKGLSQEELSRKLFVVRQTVSKWEKGLSVPDSEMLVELSKIFDTSVSTLLGENIENQKKDDLKEISEKLEKINYELSLLKKGKRKRFANFLIVSNVFVIVLAIILILLDSPYLSWDYTNPEWAVVGTIWHGFEFIFFRLAPIFLILSIPVIIFLKRKK